VKSTILIRKSGTESKYTHRAAGDCFEPVKGIFREFYCQGKNIFVYIEDDAGQLHLKPAERTHRVKNVKAVAFDLDGLLANTEDIHVLAYMEVAKFIGIRLTEDYIYRFIGRATGENIEQIIRDFHITEYTHEELLHLRYECYHDVVKKTPLLPMDGAVECAETVKRRNLTRLLVTLSMKNHALSVLEKISQPLSGSNGRVDFTTYFHAMVFGNNITRPKPAPDIYLEAVKKIDVDPHECVALEDSEAGVLSAKNAGLYVIAVPNEHTRLQDFRAADRVATSLHEITRMDFLTDE
jgi:beta-phosphoglucomutase-like phosphatase (HAD superfamily)